MRYRNENGGDGGDGGHHGGEEGKEHICAVLDHDVLVVDLHGAVEPREHGEHGDAAHLHQGAHAANLQVH